MLYNLINTFEYDNPWPLFFGGLILYHLGKAITQRDVKMHLWGFRVGVLAFVAWYLREFLVHGVQGSEQFLCTGLRGLLVMLYATSTAWIAIAIASGLVNEVFGGLRTRLVGLADGLFGSLRHKKQRTQYVPPPPPDPVAERRERERQAEQLEHQEKMNAAKRQRANIRYDLELLYDRYRAELADKISSDRFEAYFKTHLTENLSPEVYEQRAEKLKSMIRDRLNIRSKPSKPEFESLDEVIEHYRDRKQRLAYLGLDEDELETLRLTLDDMQDRDLREFLE